MFKCSLVHGLDLHFFRDFEIFKCFLIHCLDFTYCMLYFVYLFLMDEYVWEVFILSSFTFYYLKVLFHHLVLCHQ